MPAGEPLGPPTMYADVKTWNALMVSSSRLKKTTGEIIGSVMERNRRHRPAPSTCAASCSSTGTCLRPARKMTIGAPSCQAPSSTSISREKSGLPAHPPVLMPTARSARSTTASSVKRAFHTIARLTLAPISDGP
ncbi:hypothetical protein Phou_101130 [Phytohabitans houttuyneae]|uniref:Uncharacterized protein n=1 Tax=Phytohabitans houttuyneae TaxID=1076126 RepID=A0A6V8KLE9_9ACTN|nr:hypothetical protein Phou_101130 [Phytohabitans houttuyneae]